MTFKPLSVLILVTTAVAAEDPGGWSKARWGNTDEEIIQAFAGEVVLFDHPDAANHARIGIESMELADTKMRVQMVPGPDNRLQSVLISPRRLDDGTDMLFQSLGELLVQKYGHPWKSEEDNRTELQWTFKTTIVTLTRIRIAGPPSLRMPGLQVVHLQYKQKLNTNLDKL